MFYSLESAQNNQPWLSVEISLRYTEFLLKCSKLFCCSSPIKLPNIMVPPGDGPTRNSARYFKETARKTNISCTGFTSPQERLSEIPFWWCNTTKIFVALWLAVYLLRIFKETARKTNISCTGFTSPQERLSEIPFWWCNTTKIFVALWLAVYLLRISAGYEQPIRDREVPLSIRKWK